MVHIPFDTRTLGYDDYLPQFGGSNPDVEAPLHYFRGAPPFQRGYGQQGGGIGDILRGLLRILIPMVRKAGTVVGQEALSTGERILNKLAEGEDLKKSVISEGKKGVDALLEKGGLPKQFGGGGRKSIKGNRKRVDPSFTHQTLIGKAHPPKSSIHSKRIAKRRQRVDTFCFY